MQDFDAVLSKDVRNLACDVRIFLGYELLAALDDRDAAAEAAEHLTEFKADVSASENEEMLGKDVQLHDRGGIESGNALYALEIGCCGAAADVDEDRRRREPSCRAAAVGGQFELVRGDEPRGAEEPESFAYCHMNLIARRAISNFENLDLDELSVDKAYEFLFSWAPLKLVGATGSPGNPVAAY